MPADRLLRILELLSDHDGEASARLCVVSAQVTGMTGAGIMLMVGDVPRGSLCTTDGVSNTIEELQFTLGEGPCIDAFDRRRPVLEPDLDVVTRWPAFTPAAFQAGARAVFGFPIQVGATRLGALNLYRDARGPLTDEQHADASVMAEVAARTIIEHQAGVPGGGVQTQLDGGADFRLVVHQASGMVSAQLGISVGEALVRLRAYAFAHDCTLDEVGTRVVQRELRFDDDVDGTVPLP